MAWDTWTPPVNPSQNGSQMQITPRLLSSQLGDGYKAEVPDGLNFLAGTLTLSWGQIKSTDWATIEAFLTAHVGLPFIWQLPDESSPRQFKCQRWGRGFSTPNWHNNCSADLVIDFTPPP